MSKRNWLEDWKLAQKIFIRPWKFEYRTVSYKYCPTSIPVAIKREDDYVIMSSQQVLDYETGQWVPYIDIDNEDIKCIIEVSKAFPYWLQQLNEFIKLLQTVHNKVYQLISIYEVHKHPEIEAQPVIEELEKIFETFGQRYMEAMA